MSAKVSAKRFHKGQPGWTTFDNARSSIRLTGRNAASHAAPKWHRWAFNSPSSPPRRPPMNGFIGGFFLLSLFGQPPPYSLIYSLQLCVQLFLLCVFVILDSRQRRTTTNRWPRIQILPLPPMGRGRNTPRNGFLPRLMLSLS